MAIVPPLKFEYNGSLASGISEFRIGVDTINPDLVSALGVSSLSDVSSLLLPETGDNLVWNGSKWTASADAGAIPDASAIPAAALVGASFSTVQHFQDVFHSAGWTSGGEFLDNGDGTINVSAGHGLIRKVDDSLSVLFFFDWSSSANIPLTNSGINFVYVDYNAGSPLFEILTTASVDYNSKVFLGTVYRESSNIHVTPQSKHVVGDHANLMIRRMKELNPFARSTGALISEVGTRNIAITSGTFWEGLTKYSTSSQDTSGSDTFTHFYRDGGSNWVTTSGQSQINNTLYDDGTGTLATLSNNRYGVHWIYLAGDQDLSVIYGQGNYTLVQAETATTPASIPPRFENHAVIVGKIIIKKSDSVFTTIETAFTSTFNPGLATDHGDLLGLADDDHTQYLLADGTRKANTLDVTGVLGASGVIGTNSTLNAGVNVSAAGNVIVGGTVDGIDVASAGNALEIHLASSTAHFTQAEIDHTAIQNVGTNSHATIDSHIASGNVHLKPDYLYVSTSATHTPSGTGWEPIMLWGTHSIPTASGVDGAAWVVNAGDITVPGAGTWEFHAKIAGTKSDSGLGDISIRISQRIAGWTPYAGSEGRGACRGSNDGGANTHHVQKMLGVQTFTVEVKASATTITALADGITLLVRKLED